MQFEETMMRLNLSQDRFTSGKEHQVNSVAWARTPPAVPNGLFMARGLAEKARRIIDARGDSVSGGILLSAMQFH